MRLHATVHPISCPYCGEVFEIVVDESEVQQDYIEDCFVCCRPIHLSVTVEEDDVVVAARAEHE